jgi:hypothetical protein
MNVQTLLIGFYQEIKIVAAIVVYGEGDDDGQALRDEDVLSWTRCLTVNSRAGGVLG